MDEEKIDIYFDFSRPLRSTCSICGRNFQRQSSLSQHQSQSFDICLPLTRHSPIELVRAWPILLRLSRLLLCVARIGLTDNLVLLSGIYHLAVTHNGIRPFGCDIPGCSKRFTTSSNAKRHSKTHHAWESSRGKSYIHLSQISGNTNFVVCSAAQIMNVCWRLDNHRHCLLICFLILLHHSTNLQDRVFQIIFLHCVA